VKVVLDGDYGVDDALALLYLAAEPGVEIVAVGSVHGNTEAAVAADNALSVLELAGLPDVPVAVGAARPFAQDLATSLEVHGADGLGGAAPSQSAGRRCAVGMPAALQLVETVRAHPGQCTVVATGPLTNLALALLLEPAVVGLVAGVVVMGGALGVPGNVTATAEANFAHDPEAADLVLGADWPLTVVGLDVTMRTWLDEPDLERIAACPHPTARFVSAALRHYVEFYRRRHGRLGCPLHDPTAAVLALAPDLARYVALAARVELRSDALRGTLVADRRPFAPPPSRPALRLAVGIDRDAVVERFLGRLLAGRPAPGLRDGPPG
jgi:purine nucleosidase